MRDRLRAANLELLRRAAALQGMIAGAYVPGVLAAYSQQAAHFCAGLQVEARRNLKLLDAHGVDLLPDVFDRTSNLARNVNYADRRLVPPLARVGRLDELPLHVIRWLHAGTPATAGIAFATAPDEFMVLASPGLPAVYYLLMTQRRSLLSLPLLIHEFGHVLYESNKQEMDDLVKDFQEELLRHLTPQAVGAPALAARGAEFRQQVVTRWQTWAQEFFCDATGLSVGGPSFLKALSRQIHALSRDEYALDRDALLRRKHPLTWLRISRLAELARAAGLRELADRVDREWAETAAALGIHVECHGTWDDSLAQAFGLMIERMLEVAGAPLHDPDGPESSTLLPEPRAAVQPGVDRIRGQFRVLPDLGAEGRATVPRPAVRLTERHQRPAGASRVTSPRVTKTCPGIIHPRSSGSTAVAAELRLPKLTGCRAACRLRRPCVRR